MERMTTAEKEAAEYRWRQEQARDKKLAERAANPKPRMRTPRKVGWALLIVGSLMILYFGLIYDTTVSGGSASIYNPYPRRVHNIGLQQNRTLGFIAGIALSGCGGFVLMYDRRGKMSL